MRLLSAILLALTLRLIRADTRRFPLNLKRYYDGTWDASEPPFPTWPPLPRHNSTVPSTPPAPSFQKKNGFALLTAENYPLPISDSLHIVFGDLLFRDGAYRSPRDVYVKLLGIYEWTTGNIVVVGDAFHDDIPSLLKRLFAVFNKHRPGVIAGLNMTESSFATALTPRVTEHRKQYRSRRPPYTKLSIASQCPFSATFAVHPGDFKDHVPRESEFASSQGGFSSTIDNPAQVISQVQTLHSERYPHVRTSVLVRPDAEDNFMDEGQDELVEMKGVFSASQCNTNMTLILSTLDTETLFGKAINYTLMVTVVAFIQVIVLIRQMEMTSTQAGARRVSLMTVGLQAVADSYLCLGHLTMGIAVQSLFNAFATAAFFKFICFSIFLMRWMLLIWKARRPSGFSEGWEAMRRELSMLYSRFYGSLLLGIFLLYQMQNHLRFFLFALYSFWVPQIILNVVEDHRRPLLPLYILGTSITRLAIPMYFWGCPHNFLHIQPQPSSAIALVIWLMIQTLILLSQYKFGPRWFIPKQLLPEKYDYYRPIVVEEDSAVDLERGDGTNETRPLMSNSEPKRECCICMESVAIHSRERMVTPCNHFFHAACLERWLEVRLECALCRSPVPPP